VTGIRRATCCRRLIVMPLLVSRAAGGLFETLGVHPLAGRLFAILFLAPEPLALDELCERVGAAKSSVSVTLRRLLTVRVVERLPPRPDRRDFYRAMVIEGHSTPTDEKTGTLESVDYIGKPSQRFFVSCFVGKVFHDESSADNQTIGSPLHCFVQWVHVVE